MGMVGRAIRAGSKSAVMRLLRSPMSKLLHEDLTYQIRGSYFEVYNALGHDYPESFYEKALYFDIRNKGLKCVRQEEHQISYKE